jgi:hypothetical protein
MSPPPMPYSCSHVCWWPPAGHLTASSPVSVVATWHTGVCVRVRAPEPSGRPSVTTTEKFLVCAAL